IALRRPALRRRSTVRRLTLSIPATWFLSISCMSCLLWSRCDEVRPPEKYTEVRPGVRPRRGHGLRGPRLAMSGFMAPLYQGPGAAQGRASLLLAAAGVTSGDWGQAFPAGRALPGRRSPRATRSALRP